MPKYKNNILIKSTVNEQIFRFFVFSFCHELHELSRIFNRECLSPLEKGRDEALVKNYTKTDKSKQTNIQDFCFSSINEYNENAGTKSVYLSNGTKTLTYEYFYNDQKN